MRKLIDLHVHSTASDGTLTPSQLVDEAMLVGISSFALTDHDTVDGIEESLLSAEGKDLEVIPGVELSTEYQNRIEIHILGLFIDHNNRILKERLLTFRDHRDNRNAQMVEALQNEGFQISMPELSQKYEESVITRAHIARYLAESGQLKSIQHAFQKYIGDGKRCYIERDKITPSEAIELIHEAGGIAVVAHPCLYRMKRIECESMFAELKEKGLDGIEAIYSCNLGSDERDFRSLAKKYGLLVSGGSDFHGTNKPYIHFGLGKGNLYIPEDILAKMKAYHSSKTDS